MKTRNIGLDLLRVLSMMGIIGLHIMNQGGIIENASIFSVDYVLYLILLSMLYTSVNVFGLLSGYLNVEKKNNKNERIIELLSILLFWSFIITVVYYTFDIFAFKSLGMIEVVKSMFPPIAGGYWYLTSYILLFFMIPYINRFVITIDRKIYKRLLIILFILFCIIPNIFIHTDFFKLEYGYSPFWLIYMYMIGGYIKLYGINIKYNKGRLLSISILLTCALNYIFRIAGFEMFGKIVKSEFLIDYISPFTVISSILILIIFLKINVSNKIFKNIITYLSKSAFSVYIIHCHRAIFYNTLKGLFIPVTGYNTIVSISIILLSILIVYLACTLLDELRKTIFKFSRINNLISLIGEKIDSVLNT